MATREQTHPAQDSREAAFTQVLTRAYAINWETVAYAAILVLALVTRFWDLGARVMSHDESLHTYYSWRLSEFGEFNHTPLMHGPLLFHMTALSYFLFGDTDFTARIYPALLGVGIVLFPLFFRRWLGRTGAVLTSIMLLISPQLLYYSRYIRHDIPTIFFAFVLLYALLQYVDGERPRQAVWLWVIAAALLGMLSSKEVSFIYIALFGSFMVLYWLLRMLQDVGVERRPAGARRWQAPALQLAVGHLLLVVIAAMVAVPLGGFIRYLLSWTLWLPTDLIIIVPLFLLVFLPLALSGLIRNQGRDLPLALIPGKQKHKENTDEPIKGGAASAIMQGLVDGKSAMRILIAGIILGAVLALHVVVVIDVIKVETPSTTPNGGVRVATVIRSENDKNFGANLSKEFATSYSLNEAMFVRQLTWIGLPVLVVLFLVFLTAVLRFPGDVPLPWREILLVILIAILVAGVLVMIERRSFVEENDEQPFAADPHATAALEDDGYSDTPIIATWVLGTLVTLAIAASRFLTRGWDFLNREPVFDVLILLGTLVLPWLAAFPLYWAGYNLEDYNANSIEGRETLEAAFRTVIPFFMVSAAVGLSWNWKRWIPAGLIFIGLFAFFFTTVFSNQYGLVTGMIGSLGYWLEQQGVRRGSQPQYYYVLTQLPVYEFLPMIGAAMAGLFGLSQLWDWRRSRLISFYRDRRLSAAGELADSSFPDIPVPVAGVDAAAAPDVPEGLDPPDVLPGDDYAGGGAADGSFGDRFFTLSRLFRPFDVEEERSRRESDPEWVGSFPFLPLVGYWAILILLGLTIAGEKMPWLTTHLTVPLIIVSGWWLGHVVDGIRWRRLRTGGWLVLLVALPLVFMTFSHVLLGLWGKDRPFTGREIEDLTATGNWLSAVLIFLGALYLVGRYVNRLGWDQIRRMVVVAGALILGVLTVRAAVIAAYIDYDYASEYLVYAHAGPAVKTVLNEIDRIAEITNEESSMRIVFDDESSWPYTWYFRHYPNYGYIAGEAGNVDPTTLDGARVVVVGSKKVGDVRRILGDRYYEFGYIRLWWPMQEYFHLNYTRVAKVFSTDSNNVAAGYYREGLFDIWFNRDYTTYGQAMCIDRQQVRCREEAQWGTTPEESEQFREQCQRAVVAECASDDQFAANKWPVSDRMYFFVDKQIAAQVWDAGIGSSTVDIREPEYPEDQVYRDVNAERILGDTLGMVGPRGIAVDEDGLIYVADMDRNRILVMNAEGVEVLSIGGATGVGGPDLLLQPWGLDLGPDGYLYVADTWHHQVAVFTKSGELVRAWGHEGVPSSDPSPDAFWGPREVKIGPDGNVYVADTGGKRIRVYTPEGLFLLDIGSGGASLGQVDEPVGLAFNPVSGHLYVAEAWNKRIQVFDLTGVPLRAFDVNMWFHNRTSYNRPYLAFSPDGTLLYATDMDDRHRMVAYNLDGVPVFSFNQPDNLEEDVLGLRSPAGIAFDSTGRLYVVDSEQNLVYVFPPSDLSGSVLPGPGQSGGVIELPLGPGAESGDEVLEQPVGPVEGQPESPGGPAEDGEVSPVDEIPSGEETAAEGESPEDEVAAPAGAEATTVEDPNLAGGIAASPADDISRPPGGQLGMFPAGVNNAYWTPVEDQINGLLMVYVPAGCFLMGEEKREVCLSAFWLGQTEVTHGQYAACVAAGACEPPLDRTYYGNAAYVDAPAVFMTWAQAEAFADWVGGSLPTEAQWEYAARGPEGWTYPWGEYIPICGLANTANCGGLLPVGGTQRLAGASWVGARDLAGSVWEWTADWYAEDLVASLEPGSVDPPGPVDGSLRSVRGGSWQDPAEAVGPVLRTSRPPDASEETLGFRVVIPAESPETELDETVG